MVKLRQVNWIMQQVIENTALVLVVNTLWESQTTDIV